MEVERELTCRDCDNVEIIYHCKRLGTDIKHEKKLAECHYSGSWQRGDALYIWYCSKCGKINQSTFMPCTNCGTKKL